ncbi:Na+/H+ antiporter subunit E [Streptomyces hoynatensis]|uniref:Na+/H+ antiporter subunit E n=1 Tax=Streptomyces hoynatensis TaxID=1141874 RepID=A0A3A9Z2N4_9ACTN|nr:Na+/H+ antiporter subunit E [Streptomyces hoynatensis]RKN42475.1 Na+/H+ antiporter subunit E [Streptomyces hoynatensis]
MRPRNVPRAAPGRLLRRALALSALVLLWVLLWGRPTWTVLAGGLLVAAGVTALTRMPPVGWVVPYRPLRLPGLLGHLLGKLLTSSFVVAWQALRRGPDASTGVVEVRLRGDSELLLVSTALLSLTMPGTLVLEVDRARRLLYLHALPLEGPGDAERRRREVTDVERRLHRVFRPGGRAA